MERSKDEYDERERDGKSKKQRIKKGRGQPRAKDGAVDGGQNQKRKKENQRKKKKGNIDADTATRSLTSNGTRTNMK